MHEVWIIARLTALEVCRNRILSSMFGVMLVFLATAMLLASVTMGSTLQIVMDFGLAGMALLLNLLAIVLTIQLTQQEREQRTLYVLMPRLSSRCWYVLGKFAGIAFILALLLGGMAAMLAAAVWMLGWHGWSGYVQACLGTLLEVWIVVALALLFSNATSLFLAIFYTLMVDVAGRFTLIIKQFGDTVGGSARWFCDVVYYLLPNFDIVNLRNRIIDFPPLSWPDTLAMLGYAGTEIGIVLSLACLIYLGRDMQG